MVVLRDPSKVLVDYWTTEASYVIYRVGNVYYARNGRTGAIDYSGKSAKEVVESALETGHNVYVKGDLEVESSITIPRAKMLYGRGWYEWETCFGSCLIGDLSNAPLISMESRAIVAGLAIINRSDDGDGISVVGGFDRIKNCQVRAGRYGIRLNPAATQHRFWLENATILGKAQPGSIGLYDENVVSICVMNCFIGDFECGLRSEVDAVMFCNSTIAAPTIATMTYGILLEGGENIIVGNNINVPATEVGVDILGTWHNTVSNNYIAVRDFTSAGVRYKRATLGHFTRTRIVNNMIKSLTASGNPAVAVELCDRVSYGAEVRNVTHNFAKAGDTEGVFKATLSGDGVTTDFLAGAHNLLFNPPHVDELHITVTPISADARAASPCYGYASDEDGDGAYESVRVKFATAPPAGTNNVVIRWSARMYHVG